VVACVPLAPHFAEETRAVGHGKRQERAMKPLVLFASAILIASAVSGHRAAAQNYPWCADDAAGASNCGFVTFQQCLATLSGNGGFCNRNTQYVPGAPGDFSRWSGRRGR
jgi:hypothetical protein